MAEAGHLDRLKSVLNLSAEQMTAIATIQEEGRTEASRLKAELRAKRHTMMAYVSSASADQGKAMEHLQGVEAIRTQLSALRLRTWFQIRDVLTPEQLQRLQTLREKRPKRSSQSWPSLSTPWGAVLSVFG
jgi:Spy/CpxP family protein refolding chaperone